MKLNSLDLPPKRNQTHSNTPKIIALVGFSLILLTIFPLYYPLLEYSSSLLGTTRTTTTTSPLPTQSSSSSQAGSGGVLGGENGGFAVVESSSSVKSSKKCDIFTGEWIPNPDAPYYTNNTCNHIHNHQNCMRYGRPDTDFMKWRWKPDGCDLPIFNPYQFLDILRGKSLAFVGDSVARNQMQSLLCLLSRAENPNQVVDEEVSKNYEKFNYPSYNFTIGTFWTPHLVKAKQTDEPGPTNTGLFNLYLDEVDDVWTPYVDKYDYIIISAGHWFYRPMVFYEKGKIIGCHYCLKENVVDLTMYYGYRMAFRAAFQAINKLEKFKGTVFLRTFAPSHFEEGIWNQGGNCVRTKPFRSNESRLDGQPLDLYMAQVEEFRVAEREGMKKGLNYRLLDTTQAMVLRPDGHPSRYGHLKEENVTLYNDCVHWCLPGPIDAWNDMLLHMFKMERSSNLDDISF